MNPLPEDGPEEGDDDTAGTAEFVIPAEDAGERLDRALAAAGAAAGIPLSRSRIGALIVAGAVEGPDGAKILEPARRVKRGERYLLAIPPAADPEPRAQAIPLAILYEDDQLIVIDKPDGMVVHPAPGTESGTLVNALLAHCGESLAGVGDARRPGIVHRIDKDTSGLLVVAKTEAARAGLSAQFAAHEVERRYLAVVWGAPDRADPRLAGLAGIGFEAEGWIRIETGIARHRTDRKRMAVASEGRRAVTRLRVIERFGERFGPAARPVASLVECRLETGRTHQIRVHARHIGHALIGDPVYGRSRPPAASACPEAVRAALLGFPRQALHAQTLGFGHPKLQTRINLSATIPQDLHDLLMALRRNM